MRGRPPTPMYDPLQAAYADLEGGAMSYATAAAFTTLSEKEIERAVLAGEIEAFPHGRRTLLVPKSVRMWLAKKLAAARAERQGRQ